MRPATCWSWAAARPGWRQRVAAGRSGARVVLADEQTRFGGRLLAERHEIAGAPALAWAETALAELAEMPAVTLLPDTTAFGYYDHNLVALVGGGPRRSNPPAPVDGAGARGGAGGRCARAAAGLRRQRPAGRDAGGCGAHLRQPLCGGARQPRGRVHDRRRRLSHRARPDGRRGRGRGGGRRARGDRQRARGRRARGWHRDADGPCRAPDAGRRTASGRWSWCGAPGAAACGASSADLCAVSGGWQPTVHLHSQTGARPVYDPALGAVAGRASRASASARRVLPRAS